MEYLCDPGSFVPIHDGLESRDPLTYPGYRRSLERARARAGTDEAVVYGNARIGGHACIVAAFRFAFLGGSMGEVAGERVARSLEEAADRRIPFVLWTETGGARMQEGMRSLVQMAKVVAARVELAAARVPFVAVLGAPTTGGVLASVGGLADVTIATEGATIGFAGPRVARRVTGRPLSPNSHTAKSAFAHGLVDDLVGEGEVRDRVARVLAALRDDDPAAVEPPQPATGGERDAWSALEAVRDPARARGPELLRGMAEQVVPLRGDRGGAVDPALATAIARVAGRRCVVLALDHHHAPGPPAYRAGRRALGVAARLGLPVVTLVDTRGADPSEGAEASGIAWEIAATFEALLTAPVPVLAVVTGEGGSGGALAFAAGDRVVVYEEAIFTVIAPEAAAEILWRDASRAADAARLLRLTAPDLVDLGVADVIVGGRPSGASLRGTVAYHLGDLSAGPADRAAARRRRWRRRGAS